MLLFPFPSFLFFLFVQYFSITYIRLLCAGMILNAVISDKQYARLFLISIISQYQHGLRVYFSISSVLCRMPFMVLNCEVKQFFLIFTVYCYNFLSPHIKPFTLKFM